MAKRPVFCPVFNEKAKELVEEFECDFTWSPGFAKVQKRKNIAALHAVAKKKKGDLKILEISFKSPEKVGRYLSAFSLKIKLKSGEYPLESVYQASKVFLHQSLVFANV